MVAEVVVLQFWVAIGGLSSTNAEMYLLLRRVKMWSSERVNLWGFQGLGLALVLVSLSIIIKLPIL